jgi:hypothetical protein
MRDQRLPARAALAPPAAGLLRLQYAAPSTLSGVIAGQPRYLGLPAQSLAFLPVGIFGLEMYPLHDDRMQDRRRVPRTPVMMAAKIMTGPSCTCDCLVRDISALALNSQARHPFRIGSSWHLKRLEPYAFA